MESSCWQIDYRKTIKKHRFPCSSWVKDLIYIRDCDIHTWIKYYRIQPIIVVSLVVTCTNNRFTRWWLASQQKQKIYLIALLFIFCFIYFLSAVYWLIILILSNYYFSFLNIIILQKHWAHRIIVLLWNSRGNAIQAEFSK